MSSTSKASGNLQRPDRLELKLGQLNAQKSYSVANDIKADLNNNLDVLCLQEPYSYMGRVRGYTANNKRIIQPNTKCPMAAIVFYNDEIEVTQLNTVGEHVVAVQILLGKTEIFIVNAYCQFSHDIEPYLIEIEKVLNKLKDKMVIVCMDANARSVLWHAGETDNRGEIVEEFILINNLTVINEVSDFNTFRTEQGASNIDVTLANQKISTGISAWTIDPDFSFSDHNLIRFTVNIGNEIFTKKERTERYNIKKANWNEFTKKVNEKFGEDFVKELGSVKSDLAVNLFTRKLTQICDATIPKKRAITKSVPWWDENLLNLRKKMLKAKKELKRARKLQIVEHLADLINKWKTAKNKYARQIRINKCESWKDFVTKEGNEEPWGLVHKIARDKIVSPELWHAIGRANGSFTMGWEETMVELIQKAVPRDDKTDETDEHRSMRKAAIEYGNSNLEDRIGLEEISEAINKMKNKKAPGLDNINPEILRKVWTVNSDILINLYNNCFQNGSFPTAWKTAKLKLILKNNEKDPTLINSYRPISLLSVVGKVYERVIVQRLGNLYIQKGMDNKNQFGFKKNRSTDDAIQRVIDKIKSCNNKYAVAVCIDISGAFDNLWWPAIKYRLMEANISNKLLTIIESYFKNRITMIIGKNKKIKKKMQKGCPQGSILGPTAWCWCMDTLLDEIDNLGIAAINCIAYADDLLIILEGNSRNELERNGMLALTQVQKWCTRHKLKVAPEKSKAIMLKGKLDKGRLPRIKMSGENEKIKYYDEIRYLGVELDKNLNFSAHTKRLRERTINYIQKIRRLTKEKWGLKSEVLKIMYKCVFLPIMTYASVGWFEKSERTMPKRNLLAAQRAFLLAMTKACRTTSTPALQVLCGVPPLYLEIIKNGLVHNVRRNLQVIWDTYHFVPIDGDVTKEILIDEKKKIVNILLKKWQEEWDKDGRGRITYNFIPNVEFVIINQWFRPNRGLVQLLTGYGTINGTLYRRNLVESPYCDYCNQEEETVEHIIFQCRRYSEFRYDEIKRGYVTLNSLINTQENFKKLSEFANKVFKIKNKEE